MFEAAWRDGGARLVHIAVDKIREKQSLIKVVVGVEWAILCREKTKRTRKRYMRIPCPSLCIARML